MTEPKKKFGQRLERYTHPDIIGSGVWFLMHMAAEQSAYEQSPEKLRFAGQLMDLIRKKFGCTKCRKHFDEYCNQHPYDELIRKNKYAEFSKWVYDIHFLSNSFRKDKAPAETYEEVIRFFRSDESVCDEGCGDQMEIPKMSKCGDTDMKSIPVVEEKTQVLPTGGHSTWKPLTIQDEKPIPASVDTKTRQFVLMGSNRRYQSSFR